METALASEITDPDPVRQVIIHQTNRDIELEKSTQQNATGDSVGIRDHRSHPPAGRNTKPAPAKRAQHTHKQPTAARATGAAAAAAAAAAAPMKGKKTWQRPKAEV